MDVAREEIRRKKIRNPGRFELAALRIKFRVKIISLYSSLSDQAWILRDFVMMKFAVEQQKNH